MIFVAGEPVHTNDSPRQGREILDALLENPALVSASRSFRDTPEKVFGVGESSVGGGVGRRNHVYLFQREFATVDPRFINVETSAGPVVPARFDTTTPCPDEIVRRIRVSSSFKDPRWTGKLLDTYNWWRNQFVIASCLWTRRLVHIVSGLRKLPDLDLLSVCSASPDAEGPDFIFNHRRMWDYLIRHPNWKETFPMGRPRIFERNDVGEWTVVEAD